MITEDLLNEILVRLPVKSLLICTSVCKPWLSLISSPNFIYSHIKHSITKPGADQTLIVTGRKDDPMSLLHLDSFQLGASLGFPYSRGDFSLEPEVELIDSYNGVVCVSVCNFTGSRRFDLDWSRENTYQRKNPNIYLWNPAIKQSKLIPPHNLCDDILTVAIGFGFDPVGNDFKVVRIVNFMNKPRSAELYSANRNVWRTLDSTPSGVPSYNQPSDFPSYDSFDVCVNGFLCCMGLYGMTALDLNKEAFTCGIRLPVISSDYLITNFNDCIGFITFEENEMNSIFNLWTLIDEACLRGGGVEASWTLMLSINVDCLDPCVGGCFNNGDFLLHNEDGIWHLYSSDKKEGRRVPVPINIRRRVIKYNESLVSLAGSKQVDWNAHEADS